MNRFYSFNRLVVVTDEGKQYPFEGSTWKAEDFKVDEDMSPYGAGEFDLSLYEEIIHPDAVSERQKLIAFHENALKELQRND